MRRPLLFLVLTSGLILLSGPGAGAQDGPSPDELFGGRPYSVPDSVEVLSLTGEVREAVTERSFERAALILQRLLDFHTESVVSAGGNAEERFLGSRTWVHRYLRSLPEAAREAYRSMAGPQARALLDKALHQRDRRLLAEALRRFYLSGEGPSILRAAAHLELTGGSLEDAAYHLERLARDFPGAATATDRAMLGFALAKAGDRAGFARFLRESPGALADGTEVRVGGETTSLGRFLTGLRQDLEAIPPAPPGGETSWRVFGGSAARAEPLPPLAEIGEGRWSIPTEYQYTDTEYSLVGSRLGTSPYDQNRDHFPIYPVVDRGVVYMTNGFEVSAVNLYSGKLLWSQQGPLRQSERRLNRQSLLSPAIKDGVLFTNLEIPVRMPERSARVFQSQTVIFYIPQRRLFAIDTATQKILWGHSKDLIGDDRDRELLEDINVSSPPLPVGDTVYALVSKHAQRYFSYALAVDARTGRVRWRTLICTGQQELNLFGRPLKELACGAISERDGVLYCQTNLGVVAALDRRSGEIQWIKAYPQIQIPLAELWHSTPERVPTWWNSAPVVAEDTVYFAPTDSRELVALSREDGRVRFQWNGGDPENAREEVYRYLLGAGSDYLYVAGPRVLAIDRRTGKVAWGLSQGAFQSGRRQGDPEEALGRGIVTRDAVVVTTERGFYFFDPDTGDRLKFVPVELDRRASRGSHQAGGNLVKAGNVLLLSQRDRIVAFYEWEGVHREFLRRLEEDPDNAGLALEAGEVFLQGGDVKKAVAAFRRALRQAAELPLEERRRVETVAGKGLFNIHMLEGETSEEAGEFAAAAKSFQAARRAAPDAPSEIRAILSLADHERRSGSRTALRKLYMELTESLGGVPYDFPSLGAVSAGLYAQVNLAELALDEGRAAEAIGHLSRIIAEYPGEVILSTTDSQVYARERIARIIEEHGRESYRAQEEQARKLLRSARADKSDSEFMAVLRQYPNSLAMEDAAEDLGRLLLSKQDWRQASLVLRRILSEFPEMRRAPVLLYLLSVALEKRGYLFSAKSALSRLAKMPSTIEIQEEGRTVSLPALARERLEEPQYENLVTVSREIHPPLSLLWSLDEGETSYVRILPTEGQRPQGAERILFLGTNGVLRAVDNRTRELLWQHEMDGILTRLLFAGNRLIVVNNRVVAALDPITGKREWEIDIDAQVRAAGANPASVFVLTGETGHPKNLLLRSIDPISGDVVWERSLSDHEVYDMLLVTEEAVGIAARNPAGVVVFDAATGRLRFHVEMAPHSLYRAPFLVGGDKLLVAHGTRRFELIDIGTGQRIWNMEFDGEQFFRTVMPVAEGIFLADTEESLYLLDAMDGSVRWTVPAIESAPIQPRGEAADAERVYLVRKRQEDGLHYAEARDLRTGELVWRADLLVSRSADPTPIVTEHHLVYNVNSYDFARTAWSSASVFIEKDTGKVVQVIEPKTLEGLYAEAYLENGIYGLGSRGRVAIYGPR